MRCRFALVYSVCSASFGIFLFIVYQTANACKSTNALIFVIIAGNEVHVTNSFKQRILDLLDITTYREVNRTID
jgi:hypothetical protein